MEFSDKMEEIQKSLTSSDIENARRNLKRLKNMPDFLGRFGNERMLTLIRKLITSVTAVRRSIEFQIYTIKTIQKEKKSIYELIRSIPDFWNGTVDIRFTEDIEKNKINIIKDLVYGMINTNLLQKTDIMQERVSERTFEKEMEKYVRGLSKMQENEYNNALYAVCCFLNIIGKLTDNLNVHNSRMQSLKIPEMQISYNERLGTGVLQRVLDLCDIESIKKLDLPTKKILLAFYSNRLTKEIEDLMVSMFIYCKMGLQQGIMELDDETLKKLILEARYLYTVWKKNIRQEQEEYIRQKSVKNIDELGNVSYTFDFSEEVYYQGIDREAFELYFGEGSLEEDRKIMGDYVVDLNNLYVAKSFSMETLIHGILVGAKDLKTSNWGYIPEFNKTGENSIQSQDKYILIGIDFPRYNMPVRLHIDRESLTSIVNKTLGKSKIPVYKGHEDFSAVKLDGRRKYMGTQILMPIQKKQRKALEDAIKTQINNPNFNCISHLYWLAYPNRVPEHLKNEPQREVDLVTGAISLSGIDVGENLGGHSSGNDR